MHYKRPESVLVVVYTQQLQVLLLKRRLPPIGVWQSVTGSLKWGELPEQALQRELLEETGLAVHQGWVKTGVVNRYRIVPGARHLYEPGVVENTEYVFELLVPDICAIDIHPAEHSEYCWLPQAEAVEKTWSASNQAAILALSN